MKEYWANPNATPGSGAFFLLNFHASEVRDAVAIREILLSVNESDRFLVTKEFRYQVLH